jgi:hypothetical protein
MPFKEFPMARVIAFILTAATALAACRSASEGAGGQAAASASSSAPATSAATVRPSDPVAALERLDSRQNVPLLPMMANHQKQNMREHLVAVQEIVAGLAAGDFDAIDKASKRIGFSEQMGMMCTHMGAGAPGFTERALAFHHTADTIGEAARKHDVPGVLAALDKTLTTCTSCHATFKQHVVDEAEWSSSTPAGSAAMPMPMGMHGGPMRHGP